MDTFYSLTPQWFCYLRLLLGVESSSDGPDYLPHYYVVRSRYPQVHWPCPVDTLEWSETHVRIHTISSIGCLMTLWTWSIQELGGRIGSQTAPPLGALSTRVSILSGPWWSRASPYYKCCSSSQLVSLLPSRTLPDATCYPHNTTTRPLQSSCQRHLFLPILIALVGSSITLEP